MPHTSAPTAPRSRPRSCRRPSAPHAAVSLPVAEQTRIATLATRDPVPMSLVRWIVTGCWPTAPEPRLDVSWPHPRCSMLGAGRGVVVGSSPGSDPQPGCPTASSPRAQPRGARPRVGTPITATRVHATRVGSAVGWASRSAPCRCSASVTTAALRDTNAQPMTRSTDRVLS
jgi:hypothetical protein